jgi:hypothetical protein
MVPVRWTAAVKSSNSEGFCTSLQCHPADAVQYAKSLTLSPTFNDSSCLGGIRLQHENLPRHLLVHLLESCKPREDWNIGPPGLSPFLSSARPREVRNTHVPQRSDNIIKLGLRCPFPKKNYIGGLRLFAAGYKTNETVRTSVKSGAILRFA